MERYCKVWLYSSLGHGRCSQSDSQSSRSTSPNTRRKSCWFCLMTVDSMIPSWVISANVYFFSPLFNVPATGTDCERVRKSGGISTKSCVWWKTIIITWTYRVAYLRSTHPLQQWTLLRQFDSTCSTKIEEVFFWHLFVCFLYESLHLIAIHSLLLVPNLQFQLNGISYQIVNF